jgi:hypothetical protein
MKTLLTPLHAARHLVWYLNYRMAERDQVR